MRNKYKMLLVLLSLGAALPGFSAANAAEELIALKSGETVDMGNLFWVVNCKSLLTGPIVAEVLEGPPGLEVSVNQQPVIPRKLNCAKEVPGGRLIVTAPGEVKERLQGTLTVRMKYPTKDGERQQSRTINVTLLP